MLAVFPDIDECLTGKHNCSHVAVCKDTIGSYNCTCKEGYVGDGRNCSDKRRGKKRPIMQMHLVIVTKCKRLLLRARSFFYEVGGGGVTNLLQTFLLL